jgi:hypothetical protein
MKSTFWFDSDTTKPPTPWDASFDYFRLSTISDQPDVIDGTGGASG